MFGDLAAIVGHLLHEAVDRTLRAAALIGVHFWNFLCELDEVCGGGETVGENFRLNDFR